MQDWKREALYYKYLFAKQILSDHGECLCWECQKAEKDIYNWNKYKNDNVYKIIKI